MARLTGTVSRGMSPADGAYVQLQNLGGDFQAEVRTGPDGRFVLYPVPGRWRLISFAPGSQRTDRVVDVGVSDVEVELILA
ncbi:MAG TPA: DUF1416 domain-containing protein [Actinomycetota bacterium]